jgi:hypothetical protein
MCVSIPVGVECLCKGVSVCTRVSRENFEKNLLCNEELIQAHWHVIIFQNLPWLIREQKASQIKR